MNNTPARLSPAAKFWVLFTAFALAALVLFSPILLPFAAGFVLAYLFHPIVNRMHRIGIPRGLSAFFIVSALIIVMTAILALIVPPIIDQFGQLLKELPGWYERSRVYIVEHYGHYLQQIAGHQKSEAPVEQQITQHVTPWLFQKLQSLLQSSLDLFNSLALLFLTPVITLFMLRDWDKMIASIGKFFPRQHAPVIAGIAHEIDSTIAGYLRGTLIVLMIVSSFYMVSLGLIGLNYGLLIGLCAGLISFVPYLGSTGGFLVSGGVAFYQYWPGDYKMVALVCGVFIFGQLMEGNVLTPYIVGNKVRLHPVWMLFALIASGYLFGFLGLLISVPLAASTGVLVRHLISSYYGSSMHNGGSDIKHEASAANP